MYAPGNFVLFLILLSSTLPMAAQTPADTSRSLILTEDVDDSSAGTVSVQDRPDSTEAYTTDELSAPVEQSPEEPDRSSDLNTPAVKSYDQDTFYIYLQKKYAEQDKKVRELIIREMKHFLKLFEDSESAPEVLYMLARSYEENKDKHLAMAAFLKLVFRYPQSDRRAESLAFVIQSVDDDRSYAAKRGWLLDYLEQDFSDRSTADRMFLYLNVLMELQNQKLQPYTLESCYGFIEEFPQDSRLAEVVQWIGDLYTEGKDYDEAVATYDKFTLMYPGHRTLMDILYQKGILQYKELNDYPGAVETFSRLVGDYPESSIAANALFTSGEIKEKKLKDYPAAIQDYRKLVADYPTNVRAVEGLWATASLYESELKQYESAIDTYNQIVDDYPTDPLGAKALEEISAIYRKRLNDYASAADNLAKIAERYPDYDKAPDRLYDAGALVEKELREYNLAISYYQMVIDKYGSDKKARDAQKRIDRIRDITGFDEEPVDYEMETDSTESRDNR